MSVTPSGILGSLAGAPLAQRTGSDKDRTATDAANQARHAASEQKAEHAAGVGETAEDSGTEERDADGRRLWEDMRQRAGADEDRGDSRRPRPRDPSGESGGLIDLSG